MEALAATAHLLHQQWAFFTWRDGIEILFFATSLYYTAVWLKKDRQQPLLGYVYGYLALALGSYFCGLFTMSSTLFALAPVAAMVFVLIHQNTLQRNYVTLRNLTPRKQTQHTNWVELLVRSCLVAMNNEKSVTCVIEQRDSLHQFIWAPFVLNSFVQPGLLELLLQNPSYDPTTFLWLNHTGKLHAVGGTWQQGDHTAAQSNWHEDALLYTAQTDAVVLHADPKSHTFAIIAQDKLIEDLSAPQVVRIITSYIIQPHAQKGAVHYDKKNNATDHTKSAS